MGRTSTRLVKGCQVKSGYVPVRIDVPYRTCRSGEPKTVEWRPGVHRWKQRKRRTTIWRDCARQCRLTTSRAIILRPCTARNAADGSAMPTSKTKSGIRACCHPVMRVARLRLELVMKPFVIRCGTPGCDWGHKMHEMGEDQLRLLLLRVSKTLYAEARSSGVGHDAARSFGPGKLVADTHQT